MSAEYQAHHTGHLGADTDYTEKPVNDYHNALGLRCLQGDCVNCDPKLAHKSHSPSSRPDSALVTLVFNWVLTTFSRQGSSVMGMKVMNCVTSGNIRRKARLFSVTCLLNPYKNL